MVTVTVSISQGAPSQFRLYRAHGDVAWRSESAVSSALDDVEGEAFRTC